MGIRTRARAGELEISLAVAMVTRRANRFIVVMDEAVMVVMKGRFGKPVLAIVEALTHVEPSLSCCMASDPLVGAWIPHASFSHAC